ncbi:MAG: sugar phosphate isomerase/epimerase [Planctomycetota bacterium]
MLRVCFSTVACPDWTLDRVCTFGAERGFAGVEFRTAGTRGGEFAADPALTDGAKVRRVLDDAAIQAACLATSLTLDRPILPPVLGRILPPAQEDVREGRSLIDISVEAGCELVRVYPFRMHNNERRSSALVRICDRLAKVVDHTRHKNVRVVLENGGDFGKAEDLAGILASVGHPNLSAAYDIAYAAQAGDDPVDGVRLLGPDLALLRLRDRDDAGLPIELGKGVLPCAQAVGAIAETSPDAWVSTTWDRAWLGTNELPGPDRAIAHDAERIMQWAGGARLAGAA